MAFGNQIIPLFQQAAAASPTASLSPASKSKLLADMMSMPQPKTPQSWGEGLANALNMGLKGYFDTRSLRQGELDKQQKANALADALFGKPDPSSPNVADPRHDQIATMLTNGTLDPSALSPMLATKLGLSGPDYQYTTVNGTVVRINKNTGQAEPVYTSPTSSDAFTLSPGQTRYGPGGNPIANAPDVPKPPDAFTLSPGQTRFGPDGAPLANAPETPKPPDAFTLSEGQVRFGPDGQAIANNPKPDIPVGGRPFTPDERKAFGLADGQAGYMDAQGVPHTLGGTNISIDLGTGAGSVPLGDTGAPDPQAQAAFLANLSPSTAAMVKGIANYEIDPTKSTSLRGNERSQYVQMAKMYDPTYDQSQFPARTAMRKSITSGQYSQSINSANLVIQHLDALHNAISDLGNTDFPAANAIKNFTKEQTGDPSITRFNTAADAAASELAKVFKGTGVSDVQSIDAWRKNLNINGSPQQIQQAIDTAIGDLLASRLDTIRQQYQSAMGKPIDFTFLTPHSGEVLKTLGIDISRLDPNSVNTEPDLTGGAGAGGLSPPSPAGTVTLPDGTVIRQVK